MSIIGFNFKKIEAERKENSKGKINIKNNISVVEIHEQKISLGSPDNKALRFEYQFDSKYDPDLGSIKISGDIIYMADKKKAEEILKMWKKDKKIDNEVMRSILNTALNKCNIKALILAEDISLPPPLPLPKIRVGEEAKK